MKVLSTLIKKIDKIIVHWASWKHIPYSDNNFMYLSPKRYKGKKIVLKDGTLISAGDFVAELHIDNASIYMLGTSYPNLIKLLKGELTALRLSLENGHYPDIKAIFGISVFYDIARRQGFTIIDMENGFKKLLGSIWENILRLNLKKTKKKWGKKFITSKECWLSRNQILNVK